MYVIANDELYHHGVLGMKWGVRRYQSYSENPKLSDRKKAKMDYKARKAENVRKYSEETDRFLSKGKNASQEDADRFNKATDDYLKAIKDNKSQYKADKIMAKTNKKLNKSKAFDEKINNAREINLDEVIEKYGKGSTHEKVFNKYTEYVKAAQTKYSDIIKDWGKMKAEAAKDPSIKNTEEYKAAKSAYNGQRFLEWLYGDQTGAIIKVDYATKAAREDKSLNQYANKMKIEELEYKARKKAEKKGD